MGRFFARYLMKVRRERIKERADCLHSRSIRVTVKAVNPPPAEGGVSFLWFFLFLDAWYLYATCRLP